jgi:hypothetical protein
MPAAPPTDTSPPAFLLFLPFLLLARSNNISRGSRESSFPCIHVSCAYEGGSGRRDFPVSLEETAAAVKTGKVSSRDFSRAPVRIGIRVSPVGSSSTLMKMCTGQNITLISYFYKDFNKKLTYVYTFMKLFCKVNLFM